MKYEKLRAFLTLCTRGKFEDKSIEISPFEVII